MEIKYLGHSSFRIRGKKASLVTDPFSLKSVGLSFPKVKADIVTISHEHEDHNQGAQVKDNPIVIQGPGEYEVKGVRIYGYRTYHDEKDGAERGKNTIYLIVIDDIRILHCGDLGHMISDSLLDEVGDVDILIVPTGGEFTIHAKQAVGLVKKIEPFIVIPMHYKVAGLKKSFDQLQEVDVFVKELDKEVEPQDKLSVSRDKLPRELEVVILNA